MFSTHAPFLLPHLLKSVCNVVRADFFVVLKFEEFVASMTGHVDEDIGLVIGKQTF